MERRRTAAQLAFSTFLLCLFLPSFSQSEATVTELVTKNIQAAGGAEKLASLKNFSFKAGPRTFYLSSAGQMKILTEMKKPIVTEVILVDNDKVQRNCYNNISEFVGLQKATYQTLAKLRSGLFTLARLKDDLEYGGLKAFGPKKHHLLKTKVDELEVEFYLDSEEYRIERIVFKGYTPGGDKFEINHDYGVYQEIEGFYIPSSWFGSQVGTRGELIEVSDVTFNQTLAEDFFSTLEVNVGEVKIEAGGLSGSVVEVVFRRGLLMIGTNWTSQCLQKAGFKTNDKLILSAGGQEIDIEFFESQPPRNDLGPGAKIMIPNRSDENYLVYLWSEEFKDLTETLSPLSPIQVKKK